MKLISLNVLGGKFFNPLIEFVSRNSRNTDIFCFQEVTFNTAGVIKEGEFRANLLNDFIKVLPNYHFFFSPTTKYYDFWGNKLNYDLNLAQATFVKKNVEIISQNDQVILYKRFPKKIKRGFANYPIVLQSCCIKIAGNYYTISNIHGTSRPSHKLDSSKRIEQSNKINEILLTQNGKKILVGDFNLMPQTKSVKILEENMKNLIKDFKIKNTRGPLNIIHGKIGDQRFADYTFVSDDVKVKSFDVPYVGLSDHLPMILEVE